MLDDTGPPFFSYSRVFDEIETIYYRGADGQVTDSTSSSPSNSVMGTVGVLNVVEEVPVGMDQETQMGKQATGWMPRVPKGEGGRGVRVEPVSTSSCSWVGDI